MAIVLTLVAISLVTLVRRELFTNLDNSLAQRADTYQTAFAEEDNDDLSVLLNTNDEDRAAQLVGAEGVVIASTPNLANATALETVEAANAASVRNASDRRPRRRHVRVLTRDVETDSGRAVLHVAQNIDDLNDTIRNIIIALSIMVPSCRRDLSSLSFGGWSAERSRPSSSSVPKSTTSAARTSNAGYLVPQQADEISRLATTMNRMLDRIAAAGQSNASLSPTHHTNYAPP